MEIGVDGNWAGSPWGIAPPGLPQIRTCASKAHPARHVAGSLSLTRSVGLAVTCSEVRCPRHGSGSRSTTRRPLRSTGSGRARSPASALLWGAATPCRPSRLASSPSLGDTTVVSLVRPRRPGTGPRIGLELVSRVSGRQSRWRRQGLPSSRGTLRIICHVLRPRRDRTRGWDQVSLMPGTAPASDNDEDSPRG